MSDLMIGLAEIMRAEIKALDTIANNTANVNTPGYRAEYATRTNANFLTKINGQDMTQVDSGLRAIQSNEFSSMPVKTLQRNDGSIKTTGVANHLALRGAGWFVVEKNEAIYLTRNGKFQIDEGGNLKTSSGALVLGESGPIKASHADFNVASDGTVRISQSEVNRLKIATVTADTAVTVAEDGLYQASAYDVAAPGTYSVISGAYELSNVDISADMIRLIQTTRHIETIQRSISAYDQLLNIGINQLGK